MGPVSDKCRFQSTQTSRRRVAYNIGADALPREEPPSFASRERPSELVEQAERLYQRLLPSPESDKRRKQLVTKIQHILREEIPNGRVEAFVFGSSGNLLCMNDSDVDICVVVQGPTIVCDIASILARRNLDRVVCVHAKAVPIVKMWDPETQMSCDINVNNHVALTNTQLVKAYMSIGKPIVSRGLAMLVKYWTQRRLLNEASGGTLSSYTWTLLVINFLQTLGILPVIPLADAEGQQKKDFTEDVESINATYQFPSGQPQELGNLLFAFFKHYAYVVDYEHTVFSVRHGHHLPKSLSRWANVANNNRFCIEEPFTTHRNLGNTVDDTAARGIHEELRSAYRSMTIEESLDLDGSVCKKFEFAKDDYHPPRSTNMFQKPQAGPIPTLTRSRSQAGRGGKHGAGGLRASRPNDQRPYSGNRRASSGPLGGQQLLGMPLHDLLPHQLPPSVVGPDANAAYMNLEGRKVDLRLRQIQLQQELQMPDTSPQQRRSFAGIHIPQNGTIGGSRRSEAGPHSAMLPPQYYAAFNTGYGYPGGISMSPSSSQQGANSTTPGSPMLNSVSAARQHMSMPSSPGPSSRSHSQPARPGEKVFRARHLQMHPMDYFYPYNHDVHFMPQYAPQYRNSGYSSPRPNSHTVMYSDFNSNGRQHAMSTGPRTYVGYGISHEATPVQTPPAMELREIPAFDDLHRPGRGRSPRESESAVTTTSRSPSPRDPTASRASPEHRRQLRDHSARTSNSTEEGFHRGPTPQYDVLDDTGPSGRAVSQAPRLDPRQTSSIHSNGCGPLIVNGSNRSESSSEPARLTEVPSSQSFDAWKHQVLQPSNGEGNSSYTHRYSMPVQSLRHSDGSNTAPQPPYSTGALYDHPTYAYDLRKSEQNLATAWAQGKQINTSQLNGAATAGQLLSPVNEANTPSPEHSRRASKDSKAENNTGKKKTHANGSIGHGRGPSDDLRLVPGAPPVPPTRLPNGDFGQGPSGPMHVSPRTPTTPSGTASSWQPAGGKRKKHRGGSSAGGGNSGGGHPMPANAAERKGG